MKTVGKHVPPVASDYSGVCSIVFAMNSFNILYSPGGCRHPIVEVDENRNFFDTYLFATKLNDVDVVQGTEEKLIDNLKNIDLRNFTFISLIGTPITSFTGINLKRIARKIEKETGKMVVPFETNGFESYPVGISNGYLKLGEKLINKYDTDSSAIQINILGYNPLVLGNDRHLKRLLQVLSGRAVKLNILGYKGEGLQSMAISSKAKLNLVISEEGVKLAEFLKKEYSIPYIVKLPVGITEMKNFFLILEKELDICFNIKDQTEYRQANPGLRGNAANRTVLIIGEPFVSIAIKDCLEKDFGMKKISIISNIKRGTKSEALFSGARYAKVNFEKSESKIMDSIDCAEILIADPIFLNLVPENQKIKFISLPHFGLSGREFAQIEYEYIGINGFNYLKNFLNK